MRQVKEVTLAGSSKEKRYRVRYRIDEVETSETFRRKADADMFAGILGDGRNNRVTEALAWLAAKQDERDTATFGDWFESYVTQLTGVTKRTRADYRAMHRRYLTSLDNMPLPLITRAHVAGMVNDLEERGLAPKTIKNTIHMLSSALALAVDDGHLTRNPTKRVRLPKQRLVEDEVRFLTAVEYAELSAATEAHYRPLLDFLVGTGLRWSEATALQSRHVDLEHGTVRVQRAWKRIPGGWEVGPPKSEKSNRTVNAATLALAAAAPLLGKPSDLVFRTPRGNVIRHANFYNRVWQPSCIKSGLGEHVDVNGKPSWFGPSPHDLRHTHASWLISEGIGLEAVQDQLGHESIETTRKVYAKLLPAVGVAAGRAASVALERSLRHRAELVGALESGRGSDQTTDPDRVEADVRHDRDSY